MEHANRLMNRHNLPYVYSLHLLRGNGV